METVKAVLSGFIGIRKRAEHERLQLNPVYVIVTAILFVVLFIFTIRTIGRKRHGRSCALESNSIVTWRLKSTCVLLTASFDSSEFTPSAAQIWL